MLGRIGLFGLLLALPLIGFGIAEAIRAHFNSELRSALRKEYPQATEEQLAQVTLDQLCEDFGPALGDICETNSNLKLMSRAALGAGAAGLCLILLISAAGRLARNSRSLLVLLFTPALYLTAVTIIGLIFVHAAVAMAAIYYGGSVLVGRVHVGAIATIGVGALAGILAIARGTFSLVRKARIVVVGKALTREEAPHLWNHVDRVADRLGALRPDNLVVGLKPEFFVTEAEVACLSGRLRGRTLYCALPLCRILSRKELAPIIGHELGHFKGQDTKFSRRFYPIYRGTVLSLAGLEAAAGNWGGTIALLPAFAVLSYLLECFAVAERQVSRERELAADQAGASVRSPEVFATALVKLHAFAGVWEGVERAVVQALREGMVCVNLSKAYAEAVGRVAGLEALGRVMGAQLSHPTDSHPPLSVRSRCLGVEFNEVAADALAVAPRGAAIRLISGARRLEEEISRAYQLVLAREGGIELERGEGSG